MSWSRYVTGWNFQMSRVISDALHLMLVDQDLNNLRILFSAIMDSDSETIVKLNIIFSR